MASVLYMACGFSSGRETMQQLLALLVSLCWKGFSDFLIFQFPFLPSFKAHVVETFDRNSQKQVLIQLPWHWIISAYSQTMSCWNNFFLTIKESHCKECCQRLPHSPGSSQTLLQLKVPTLHLGLKSLWLESFLITKGSAQNWGALCKHMAFSSAALINFWLSAASHGSKAALKKEKIKNSSLLCFHYCYKLHPCQCFTGRHIDLHFVKHIFFYSLASLRPGAWSAIRTTVLYFFLINDKHKG